MAVWALALSILAAPAAAVEQYTFNTRNAQHTIFDPQTLDSQLANDIICLALNIYHEARGTPYENQLAVALVTRNRAQLLGRSYCDVVWERGFVRATGRWIGQFSWTTRVSSRRLDKPCWDRVQQIAMMVITDHDLPDITNGATHFFESVITPSWSRAASHRRVIGAHTFIRIERYVEVAQSRN
jgi:N-acetylmuramoyl-L-alanine amidase